jgi:hypothetical protein
MAADIPIINILTYRLPFDLANQMYNEFHARLKEAKYLIENYKTYKSLTDHIKTVELLLSLSIFHRRVIANFDGAIKFYGTVTKKTDIDTIRIGEYNLTAQEKNKVLSVVISYQQLLEKFSIPHQVMEYYETREFLKKIISLKTTLTNAESKNNGRSIEEEDVPF